MNETTEKNDPTKLDLWRVFRDVVMILGLLLALHEMNSTGEQVARLGVKIDMLKERMDYIEYGRK